tara:strand:+ start:1111 stop:2049 length:939 start_codon:yes stop_codon:yes gene_type:complete
MKSDPINFILENNINLEKKFYLISGNEQTLMERTKDKLIDFTKKTNLFEIEKIDEVSQKSSNLGLFNKNKLYLIKSLRGVDNSTLDNLYSDNEIFVFIEENKPKNKLLKKLFVNRADSVIFDCYELSKESKIKIVKKYLDNLGMSLGEEEFWRIIEKLDNRFMLLEKELLKLNMLENKVIDKKKISILFSKNNSETEKIFFKILNSEDDLVREYFNKITNDVEANSFYYNAKQLSYFIINNTTKLEFENNFPKYLFREKNVMLSIFNKYNNKKRRSLLNLFYITEKLLRTNRDLSVVTCLRFLLGIRKITVS